MKRQHFTSYYLYLLVACMVAMYLSSCKKDALLNAKPQTSLALPTTLDDLQSMLELNTQMNQTPSGGDAASDNYYMTNTFYASESIAVQNFYTWQADVYQGKSAIDDWTYPYQQVLTANIVLDALNNIQVNATNQSQYEQIKGSALFFRAFAFFNVATLWSPAYDSATADKDFGIPLRLSPDVATKTTRSSVKQTYDQIISDLNTARPLIQKSLPVNNKNRPSLCALYGLSSRLYLSMRNYVKAGLYADSALQLYNGLVDFNTVKMSTTFYQPFTILNNNEVVFSSYQLRLGSSPSSEILNYFTQSTANNLSVDTVLLKLYAANDLRKNVFFYSWSTTSANLNGSYAGTVNPFSGFATNEFYLNRAESYARSGNLTAAVADLNTLLKTRWKTNTYTPQIVSSASAVLNVILAERRKELPFSSVRWLDLRRLNKEGYNILLTRIVNGQTYTLQPNDKRYVLPIPPDVIQFSGIEQNPR